MTKFFFPDSQDQVDPSFDFINERSSSDRVRQRHDEYAHEALGVPPYDGILISKAMVDGYGPGTGKYTSAQRNRLYRDGAHAFFRTPADRRLAIMGDCGAFSYAREQTPPWSVREVLQFYTVCGLDLGISVDHLIFAYDRADGPGEADWIARQELTLSLAQDFLTECRSDGGGLTPVGVAQGWGPSSYASAVLDLERMGYDYVALGGMVPLKTRDILNVLAAVADVKKPATRIHLLGVSRLEAAVEFRRFGVTSFDSTSPLRQAFMDATDNYYWPSGNLIAVRVPQVDGNPMLKRRILAGEVQQDVARRLERAALVALRDYANRTVSLADALAAVAAYERLWNSGKLIAALYAATLEARPWETCACRLCGRLGVDIVIFRGSERNKSRGFHNLHVFSNAIANLSSERTPAAVTTV